MTVMELRKILNAAGSEAEVQFEHAGEKTRITGYTIDRNLDGSTKALLLKTTEAK